VQHRNLDFEIPLLREQWDQLGNAANFRPDYGVLRWDPVQEWGVIRVAIRVDDAPSGWEGVVPDDDGIPPDDLEVARFVYNDGRPYAQVDLPAAPTTPAILPDEEQEMQVALERWVREKWHDLMRDSGIHYDRGALPATEPNPPA
jgi:hypothetical protein